MKLLILFLVTFFVTNAFGEMTIPPNAKELSYLYEKNLLKNPSFELGRSGLGGGTTSPTINSTAANVFKADKGQYSLAWNPVGADTALLSEGVAVKTGSPGLLIGKCYFQAIDQDYVLQLYDGSNVLASKTIATDAVGSVYNEGTLVDYYYTGASDATLYLRLSSPDNNDAIYTDVCSLRYIADPKNFIGANSDWEALTGITGSWVANTTYSGKFKRSGDSADLQLYVTVSGAPTSAALTITLPSPLIIDTDKLNSTAGGASHLGLFTIRDVSASITYVGQVTYTSSTTISLVADVGNAAGNPAAVTQAVPMIFASGDFIDIKIANLPIEGWSSGFVTQDQIAQNNPANFNAAKNATQSLATGTPTKITFQTITSDDSGNWDSTNNRWVIKKAGYYIPKAQLHYANNTTGARDIYLYKNGSSLHYYQVGAQAGSLITVTPLNPPAIYLVPGDYLEIYGSQNSGGNLNVVNDSATFFSVTKQNDANALMNIRKVATLKDEKAAGTEGGGFTSGAFQTRTLNTENDPYGIVALSSNQFTLQAGTYRVRAKAPAYSDAGAIDRHQSKIRNITDSTDALIGSSEFNGTGGTTTSSEVDGIITITSAKTFELQHRCGTTQATFGFGLASNFGVSEVYATVEIEQLQ